MRLRFVIVCSFVIGITACASAPPTPTPTLEPIATRTATHTPTATATLTTTPTLTHTPTPTKPRATASPTRPRLPTATRTPTAPSPTPSAAQMCAQMLGKVPAEIYVFYLYPEGELIWDNEPHYFRVGLCNTNAPPAAPQGKYKITFSFPPTSSGATESKPSPAELKLGFNEIRVGPWVPGLENHLSRCAARANAVTRLTYNDTPDPFYRVLTWYDGRDHIILPIKCGGNFP